MDERRLSISAQALYSRLGTGSAPILVDVRRSAAFEADRSMIGGQSGASRQESTGGGAICRRGGLLSPIARVGRRSAKLRPPHSAPPASRTSISKGWSRATCRAASVEPAW